MENRRYLKLNDWLTYRTAFHLSNYVWKIIIKWDWFAKSTVGTQFVDAIDSISANMAEGWGRYNRRDKIKFYRYALASCKEALDWNQKSKVRELLEPEEYDHIFQTLEKIPRGIRSQIRYTNEHLKE